MDSIILNDKNLYVMLIADRYEQAGTYIGEHE